MLDALALLDVLDIPCTQEVFKPPTRLLKKLPEAICLMDGLKRRLRGEIAPAVPGA